MRVFVCVPACMYQGWEMAKAKTKQEGMSCFWGSTSNPPTLTAIPICSLPPFVSAHRHSTTPSLTNEYEN